MKFISHPSRSWSSGLIVFLLTCFHVRTSASRSFVSESEKNFFSFPLIPHHVHKERVVTRRLLETTTPSSSVHRDEESHVREQVDALYQGYGTHYVDIWCGSPIPQRQTVIIDTFSAVTAFPCTGCDRCGKEDDYHLDEYFDTSYSTTYQESACDMDTGGCDLEGASCTIHDDDHDDDHDDNKKCKIHSQLSCDTSWSGYTGSDFCYVGGLHQTPLDMSNGNTRDITHHSYNNNNHISDSFDPFKATQMKFRMKFACEYTARGLFRVQLADGVMGLNSSPSSYLAQLKASGQVSNTIFALCFSFQPIPESKNGTEAGAMTIGGYDDRLHRSPIVFANMTNIRGRPGYDYMVTIRRIYFLRQDGTDDPTVHFHNSLEKANRPPLPLGINYGQFNRYGTLIDSGTTDTYLNEEVASAFKELWLEIVGTEYSLSPVNLTEDELRQLPTIVFQIHGYQSQNSNHPHTSKNESIMLAGTLDPENPTDILWEMPPWHYMEYNPSEETFTPRLYLTNRRESIFGANMMMGHDVVFDLESNRLGLAKSDCLYSQKVRANGYTWDLSKRPRTMDTIYRTSHRQKEFDSAGVGRNGLSTNGSRSFVFALLASAVGTTLIFALVFSRFRKIEAQYHAGRLGPEENFSGSDTNDDTLHIELHVMPKSFYTAIEE